MFFIEILTVFSIAQGAGIALVAFAYVISRGR